MTTNRKLAYLVSRFPKISETFILYEIIELRKLGFEIDIFPLVREREAVQHPEVASLTSRTHYHSVLSAPVILAQLFWITRRPIRYFGALWNVIWGNIRSPKFLVRGIAAFLLAGLFAREIERSSTGHIHAHWATHPALAAYVVHRLTDLPYSFTAHAHDIYVEQAMLREKIKDSDFVVTISEFNRRFLEGLYGQELAKKIDVIHCGIDLNVFRPHENAQKANQFTLICVASLEEKKGHRYLIEACAQLVKKGVALTCLLVGDGDLRAELEAMIQQHDLSQHVKLLGRQPRHRVGELLAQSHALVLPSIVTSKGKMEGIPVALMEALAMQMPVIATNISGISELVEHNITGLLVPEKDASALADAIDTIRLNPGTAAALGKRGREKVIAEFDLHANTKALSQRFLASNAG
jgi:colanic acid/amylovoran biosynthesis glycosyltransferase